LLEHRAENADLRRSGKAASLIKSSLQVGPGLAEFFTKATGGVSESGTGQRGGELAERRGWRRSTREGARGRCGSVA